MIDSKTLDRIKNHEGYRGKIYLDTLSIETIGYGRNLKVHPLTLDEKLLIERNNGVYSKSQAHEWLLNHCETLEKELTKFTWYNKIDDFRKSIILDMAYQLGIPRLLKFKLMILELNILNYKGASYQMMKSTWAIQTPQRVKRLALMMEVGEDYYKRLRNA